MKKQDLPYIINTSSSKVSYFLEGDKQKETGLFFLNGMYKGKESWIKQIRNESFKKNYKMIFMDYPGFGDTVLPDNNIDYMKLVMDNMNSILNKESKNGVNLIGYSLGGVFASLFASLYPERVNTLILINSGIYLSSYMKIIVQQSLALLSQEVDFSMMYPYIFPWHYSEEYLEKIIDFNDFKKTRNGDYKKGDKSLSKLLNISNSLESYEDCIRHIKCPLLFLGGSHDMVFPIERQKSLFNNREDFQMKIFQGASHSTILENYKEVNNCMEEFLGKYNRQREVL